MSSTCQSCSERAGRRESRPALLETGDRCAEGARTAGLPAGDTVARARCSDGVRAFSLWFLRLLFGWAALVWDLNPSTSASG
jgi:hypothetical protein